VDPGAFLTAAPIRGQRAPLKFTSLPVFVLFSNTLQAMNIPFAEFDLVNGSDGGQTSNDVN
jgi:hypothetical protein